MNSSISGRCACGAVHYEADTAPGISLQCHCRDCQRAHGWDLTDPARPRFEAMMPPPPGAG
jgi:hypothetical protein